MFFTSLRRSLCIRALPFGVAMFALATPAAASNVQGRITVGGYVAEERYSPDIMGASSNDWATASARYYLRVSEAGEHKNWTFVSDIRDNEDFFGSLNAAALKLAPLNTFQVKELEGTYETSNRRMTLEGGRFAVVDAGGVTCDGARVVYHPSSSWSFAAFAGLDPKRNGDRYVTFHSDAEDAGVYARYQSPASTWNHNVFADLALVEEVTQSQVDRQYLYSNTVYQWSLRSHLFELLYLDFVPNVFVQTGFIDYMQELKNNYFLDVQLLGVDVIEYLWLQNVRSQLSPEPYKEGTVELRYEPSPTMQLYADYQYGERAGDGLERTEYKIGVNLPRRFSPKWDFSARGGYRRNFVSDDVFGQFGLGYFTNRGEVSVEAEYANETYYHDRTLNPLTLSANFGMYFRNSLFGALSLEHAQDEDVEIWSTFFKLSYRWGSKEIPPIRDGAAPRGRL